MASKVKSNATKPLGATKPYRASLMPLDASHAAVEASHAAVEATLPPSSPATRETTKPATRGFVGESLYRLRGSVAKREGSLPSNPPATKPATKPATREATREATGKATGKATKPATKETTSNAARRRFMASATIGQWYTARQVRDLIKRGNGCNVSSFLECLQKNLEGPDSIDCTVRLRRRQNPKRVNGWRWQIYKREDHVKRDYISFAGEDNYPEWQ